MKKKYIVRLSNDEREELQTVIKKLVETSQKVQRAQIFSRQMLMVRAGLIPG